MHLRPHVTVPVLGLAVWILSCLGFPTPAATPAQPPPASEPRVIRNIPYGKPAGKKIDPRQTLDLYLPQGSKALPPLVIFIHGGFWTLSDDKYRIGPNLAEALAPHGVAVALVRYRLAPAHRHPAQAEDVAAAVAYLARESKQYGYDGRRLFVAGHSAGAHLAALVALDSGYLSVHHISPQSLAGVIALSGIYNLQPTEETAEQQRQAVRQTFGDHPDGLKAASPRSHAGPSAPPFLILAAESDFPGFPVDAKRLADSLRGTGHSTVRQLVIPGSDHFSIVRLGGLQNIVRDLVLDFLKIEPLPQDFAALLEAKQRWIEPPFSTLPFWRNGAGIRAYPVDARFVGMLLPIYVGAKHELLEWPLEKYYALDLLDYLESLPPEKIGRGDYLTLTNVRNEKTFWERRQIAPYKPLLVVGIDDEKNLFRLGTFYQPLREYSWKDSPPAPMMARPVGAFIHFLEEPPAELRPQISHYGLTEDSFRLAAEDPLAPFRKLDKELYEALTFRNGCVYCHSVRGSGPQSHHVAAADGAAHRPFALPLESYPPEVWTAFIFNQHEVAAKVGTSPNVVDEEARQALYDLVVESREQRPSPVK